MIYVQDDWHAKSWLTLNIGLRWDHFSPITAAQGQRSNFDPVLAAACTPPVATLSSWAQRPASSPIGRTLSLVSALPLTPRKNLVIRGGFGMSRFAQDYASGSLNHYNPPFILPDHRLLPATGHGRHGLPGRQRNAFPGRSSRADTGA